MLFLPRKCLPRHWLVILLMLITPSLGKTAYKWVDKDGIIHYSQLPPSNQEVQEITLPAPTNNPTFMPESLQKRLQQLQQKQLEQDRAAAEKTHIQNRLAARKRNCEVARENLELYQGNPRWLIGDKQGNYIRLSETERRERIAEVKQQIEANCD
jgi:hypothetical protein